MILYKLSLRCGPQHKDIIIIQPLTGLTVFPRFATKWLLPTPVAGGATTPYGLFPPEYTMRAGPCGQRREREREREVSLLDKLKGVPTCQRYRRWPSDVTAVLA
jgi:hypothetical protein